MYPFCQTDWQLEGQCNFQVSLINRILCSHSQSEKIKLTECSESCTSLLTNHKWLSRTALFWRQSRKGQRNITGTHQLPQQDLLKFSLIACRPLLPPALETPLTCWAAKASSELDLSQAGIPTHPSGLLFLVAILTLLAAPLSGSSWASPITYSSC